MKKIANKSVLALLLALILLLQPQGMVSADQKNLQSEMPGGIISARMKYAVTS